MPETISGTLLCARAGGVLITGPSGCGKTTCAVNLVRRGYAFVADDAVRLCVRDGCLWGGAPEATLGLIALRGLGIVSAKQATGQSALHECVVRACVEVCTSDADSTPLKPRTGTHVLLGVTLPSMRVHCTDARYLSDLVETCVRILMPE